MTINRAQPELLALAAAVRGDEWADELAKALAAAANAGWTWELAAWHACQLMFKDDAHPRDLRERVRDPRKPGPALDAPPTAAQKYLAEGLARAEAASARYRSGRETGGAA